MKYFHIKKGSSERVFRKKVNFLGKFISDFLFDKPLTIYSAAFSAVIIDGIEKLFLSVNFV